MPTTKKFENGLYQQERIDQLERNQFKLKFKSKKCNPKANKLQYKLIFEIKEENNQT